MSETTTAQPEPKKARTRDKFKVMQAIVKDFKELSPNDQAWVMGELASKPCEAPSAPEPLA